MNDEELIERIVALNYREFGANVGNDLKRIIIKKEDELDKYKNIIDELEKWLKEKSKGRPEYTNYDDVLNKLKELKGE